MSKYAKHVNLTNTSLILASITLKYPMSSPGNQIELGRTEWSWLLVGSGDYIRSFYIVHQLIFVQVLAFNLRFSILESFEGWPFRAKQKKNN